MRKRAINMHKAIFLNEEYTTQKKYIEGMISQKKVIGEFTLYFSTRKK